MAATRPQLARKRKALGYSQERFAETLDVDRSTVARWERGETEPQPHIRPKLAQLLKLTTAELETLFVPQPTGNDPVMATPQAGMAISTSPAVSWTYLDVSDVDEMNRREFLQILSITGTLVALPPIGSDQEAGYGAGPFAADLDRYSQVNAHLWQSFSLARTKSAVYPMVREHLSALIGAFERTRTEAEHKGLCTATADLLQLAGEIFFDSNRYTEAAHCYTLAASAAREAGTHDLWACALTRQAFISLYERQFARAVPLLNAASELAKRGDHGLSTRHWVAVVQAEAFASLGDVDSCNRALDLAGEIHSLRGQVHNGGWLRFDGSRLAEERGTCYTRLGRPDLAEEALAEALNQPLSPRRRASVLTDLAILGVQQRDSDRLLFYAGEALSVAQQNGSGYVGRKLRELQGRLEPLKADRRISALSSQIASLPAIPS
ncbi:helix-turn-helix transcriptional regulator [Streptomyces sp. FH025]|uniref:helix-turn-helix domain-containing protein n=1 Tax=Streptomyces sp. FH025 TaxID=2815937 RepID=UPI001A9F15B8|nr:helix-turn-helix transcriptional regulator [Streptomyces sp. FH025]MBO1413510.1 helix-turn-helix transcriptional regulator [Streptomyces sp. FH025]